MAEIVTSILRIASILCSCNGNNTWYLCDLQENKDALGTAMDELKETRDDVQKQVVEAENNPNEPMECKTEVSGWLKRVQAIEGEVMKVILKADKEIKGRCIGGYCSINCWSRYEIGKLVTQRLATVKDLKTKGSFVGGVAHKLSPPLVQIELVDSTVGMESMFDKVWRLLAEDEVRIMGLYGQGGVGKTTLLKQINNVFHQSTTTASSSNLHGFDVVIFVVVSKVINIDAIQKEIGSRLGLSSPTKINIFNALTKKNFVLLLDDLWERVDLQSIGIPPRPLENKKSKVVFTTRSAIVCGHMDANIKFRVECLPWDEAWTLFQEKVGNEALNCHSEVPELAKDVARDCGGLPLALITVGRATSTKRSLQEWKQHAIATVLQGSACRDPHHQNFQVLTEQAPLPVVRIYAKQDTGCFLTIKRKVNPNHPVTFGKNDESDVCQYWMKDDKYGASIKDVCGYPTYALVNKFTGQALKPSNANNTPVELVRYNPNVPDESILWSEVDLSDGYKAIRNATDPSLNLDGGSVTEGSIVHLWTWFDQDNQRWKMVPYA